MNKIDDILDEKLIYDEQLVTDYSDNMSDIVNIQIKDKMRVRDTITIIREE